MNRPKTITNDESKKLIHWLDNRHKVIFDLAIQSGLRISDILRLRVKDISNPMTIYEKKSKRKRTFQISSELQKHLEFLSAYKNKNDFIFESHHKHAASVHRSTVHRHIKKAAKWSNLDCSTHSARKLYAKNIFEQTGSVEAVQKALNHRKITTTHTYLDIVQQNVLELDTSATEHAKCNIIHRALTFIKKLLRKEKPY